MIYICIPTHNEQQTVGVVLWKLRQVLTDFPRDYQLLVADDGSTDKTPEVLEPYTRVLPLTVIRSETRQGTAASLEMLLREAVRRSEYPKRDAIVTLQADFSEEPDDMVPLVKRLEAGADVAVGNKVSTTKETRARRFARSLARFFVRRQKWPEGVVTPFDGYRAYRLYAVKRAIEERGSARLLRHDGWACQAELLKAVLPHARRVDVLDVDDRPDRLQRPRREKPLAAAMQVRVMASGVEPTGLVGVEELDRIAMTASRGRERAAITPESIQADRGVSRTNGSRTRQSGRRDQSQSRGRSQSNGASRGRPEGERPRRDRAAQGDARTGQSGESRGGRQRTGPSEGSRRQARAAASDTVKPPRTSQSEPRRPAGAATPAPEELVQPIDLTAEGVAPESESRPKRKRRRRKRGGQSRAAGTATGADEASAEGSAARSGEASAGSTTGSVEASAEGSATGSTDGDGNTADSTEYGTAGESSGSRRPPRSSRSGATAESPAEGGADDGERAEGTDVGEGGARKRRRRGGRRGGRGRRRTRPAEGAEGGSADVAGVDTAGSTSPATAPAAEAGESAARAGSAGDRSPEPGEGSARSGSAGDRSPEAGEGATRDRSAAADSSAERPVAESGAHVEKG